MGEGGMDIRLSDRARDLFPFAVEAKANKAFAIYKVFDQAQNHADKEGLAPMVVIQGDFKPPLAVIDLEILMELLPNAKTDR